MAEHILKSQPYLYLLAQLTEATVNKEKAEKDYDLFLSEKNAATYHYEEALDELSRIATQKAILESENKEIPQDVQECYNSSLVAFATAKALYEKQKEKCHNHKTKMTRAFKKAQKELESFLIEHEEELLKEKTILHQDITILRNLPPYYSDDPWVNCDITKMEEELEEIKEALSIICNKKSHTFENNMKGFNHFLICKRCGKPKYARPI